MDQFTRATVSLNLLVLFLCVCLLSQTTVARSIPTSLETVESRNAVVPSFLSSSLADERYPLDASPAATPALASSPLQRVSKRRFVVRVPYAQTPDYTQLHRLYKTLFNTKQKKYISLQSLL